MREQPGRDQVCPGRPTDDQRDRSDCPEGGHRNRLERQAADWMRRSAQEAIGGEQGREAKKDAGRVKGADPDLAGSNDDERSEEKRPRRRRFAQDSGAEIHQPGRSKDRR